MIILQSMTYTLIHIITQIEDRKQVPTFYAFFYFIRKCAELLGFVLTIISVMVNDISPWQIYLYLTGALALALMFICKSLFFTHFDAGHQIKCIIAIDFSKYFSK